MDNVTVLQHLLETLHSHFSHAYNKHSTKPCRRLIISCRVELVLVRGMATVFSLRLRPFISFFSLPRMFVFVSRTSVSMSFLRWTSVVFVCISPVKMFFLGWTPLVVTTTPLWWAPSTGVIIISVSWTPSVVLFLDVHWTSEGIFLPVSVLGSPSMSMRVFFPVWKAPFSSRRRWNLYMDKNKTKINKQIDIMHELWDTMNNPGQSYLVAM